MKSIRTFRGTIGSSTDVKRLIAYDGNLSIGYKVVGFETFPATGANWVDSTQVLTTNPTGSNTIDASDNRQIGWAVHNDGSGYQSVLDPEHIVVSDLFLYSDVNVIMNYLVTIERMEITDNQAVMSLIKERAQDDLNRSP